METFGLKLNYRPVVMKSKLFSEAESPQMFLFQLLHTQTSFHLSGLSVSAP